MAKSKYQNLQPYVEDEIDDSTAQRDQLSQFIGDTIQTIELEIRGESASWINNTSTENAVTQSNNKEESMSDDEKRLKLFGSHGDFAWIERWMGKLDLNSS